MGSIKKKNYTQNISINFHSIAIINTHIGSRDIVKTTLIGNNSINGYIVRRLSD